MFNLSADVSVLLGLVAGVLFILALKGLSHPSTARRGNTYGMVGMGIAVGVALLQPALQGFIWVIVALAVGAAVGLPLAQRTPLTHLPQLVAGFHSFIGLAAALVAAGMYLQQFSLGVLEAKTALEMGLGAAIGMITFSGSVLAALKLQGWVSGTPWAWKGRHALNLALGLALVGCIVWFVATFNPLAFALVILLSTTMGYTLVAPIGGADMPVIVSMLNSYSGWAAAATGFMLENPLLIITGALVGASGAILSFIMCKAMNRSFISVIAGGFGAAPAVAAASGGSAAAMTIQQAGPEDAGFMLAEAEKVIIIPGYGMAVAQAQHAVKELFNLLSEKGVEVKFAIHPVAGRMPGHMNVLLAEADIPYDAVHELEEINPDFGQADVALVLGANDVVNPDAQNTPGSPIYGMPVLQAWKARQVYVVKRSHRPGYAGVDNPLFGMTNTSLVLGDAKEVVEKLVLAVKNG